MQRKPISPRLRFIILKRDGFACHYCGQKAPDVELHVDHIVPVASGGSNDDENLITACVTCNQGKGAQVLDPGALDANAQAAAEAAKKRKEELAAVRQSVIAESVLGNEELCEAIKAWQSLGGPQLAKRHLPLLRESIRENGLANTVIGMKNGLNYWSKRDVRDLAKLVLHNIGVSIRYATMPQFDACAGMAKEDVDNVRYAFSVLRNRGLAEDSQYAELVAEVREMMDLSFPTSAIKQLSKKCHSWAEIREVARRYSEIGESAMDDVLNRKWPPFGRTVPQGWNW